MTATRCHDTLVVRPMRPCRFSFTRSYVPMLDLMWRDYSFGLCNSRFLLRRITLIIALLLNAPSSPVGKQMSLPLACACTKVWAARTASCWGTNPHLVLFGYPQPGMRHSTLP